MHTSAETCVRAVYCSVEKQREFKAKSEALLPVKITGFRMKRNSWSNEDEIHMNKRTKLEEPSEQETNFDFKVPNPENEHPSSLTPITTIGED